ncbi:MAG: hypothetical protein TU36_003625 [Vulcanisaeta sp. AZ3]
MAFPRKKLMIDGTSVISYPDAYVKTLPLVYNKVTVGQFSMHMGTYTTLLKPVLVVDKLLHAVPLHICAKLCHWTGDFVVMTLKVPR